MTAKLPSRRLFLVSAGRGAGLLGVWAAGLSTSGCKKAPLDQARDPAVVPTPAKPAEPASARDLSVVLGKLVGPGRHDDPATGKRAHYLSILDLDAPSSTDPVRIPMGFFGHGVTPRLDRRHVCVVFEKHGPGCCEIDMDAGRVTRTITTTKDRHFYGHGVFSADGARLYCTESVVGDKSERGVIAVRDATDYKLMGTLPSFGHAPHDLHLVDGGKTLVATNGGGRADSSNAPSLVHIDIASGKLVRKRTFDTARVNAGHVALAKSGAITVVSAPRRGIESGSDRFLGGVSFRDGDNDTMRTSRHKVARRFKGEVLSVAIDPATGIAATTCPDGGLLAFWDAASGAMMGSVELPKVRGVAITLDGRYFAVTHGEDALVSLYGTRTLSAKGKPRRAWMSGSHVLIHAA